MLRRFATVCCLTATLTAAAQEKPKNTILAVGAHAGDMELTCGALLAKEHAAGSRVVLLHLTLGERGNPKLSPDAYAEQKKREAMAVAEALGAEVRFGPWHDGELPVSDEARLFVARVIREVKPTNVITHWKSSMHKDHEAANVIVRDAVLLAALEGVLPDVPVWRGVRSVWYADNWEDADGFSPYVYVDVTGAMPAWREAVGKYEFTHGTFSGFAYLDYYTGLASVRGAEARKGQAEAFDIESYGKRRVLDRVP
ncbi:MAG TPA: PIG-L family deacetylase [Thermoanaerobaculia bacterium]|nr:PIG-L family deacetylase [Thermoanaerobaculia bacterium]